SMAPRLTRCSSTARPGKRMSAAAPVAPGAGSDSRSSRRDKHRLPVRARGGQAGAKEAARRVKGFTMASFRGHISFAAVLGAIYGAAGSIMFGLDWGPVFLGAGLTTIGGLMPDLDSDSGVPVRELFNLAAVIVPLLFARRLLHAGMTPEQV